METTATIRRATGADAARLARFAEQTFRETFASMNTPENMELHCALAYGEAIQAGELADPATTVLFCELGTELVGYVQLRRGDAPTCVDGTRPIEILRFYVASGWHGRGIAQLMMESALGLADEEGFDVAWLGVWERNPRAIAFYAKFGFVEVGDHVFSVGNDPQRDVVMMLRRGRTRGVLQLKTSSVPA